MKLKQQINRVHPSVKLEFNFSHKDRDFLNQVLQERIQLIQICLTNNYFQGSYDKLCSKLIERGYKKQEINDGTERTKTLDRQKLLEEKQRNEIIEYHLYWQTIEHYLT